MEIIFQRNPRDYITEITKSLTKQSIKGELGNKLNNEIHNYETFEKILIQYLK